MKNLVLTVFLLLPCAATGCPLCHSETGRNVERGIFASDFGVKLVAVAAPFPVFGLFIFLLYGRSEGKGSRRNG